MFGLLPPSSSVIRLIGDDAIRMISPPVSVEPVNAILSTPGCCTRYAPVVLPGPGTMLTAPGGMPTSVASSPSRNAVSGVAESGFSTTVQPAARAGASFHVVIISG
jgi:hypothetical protein